MKTVSLFFGMLVLAVANRLWLAPALTRKKDQQRVSLLRLRPHVLAEEIAGILIAAIVSILGIIEPTAG
jgi:putative copper resistance protein D